MSHRLNQLFELANSYASMYRFSESEKLYNQIILEDEGYYGAYVNLALLYTKYNKDEEAYQVALRAREFFGGDKLINQYIYFYYKNNGDYVKAEDILLETLREEPEYALTYIRYAELLILSGLKDKQKIKELIQTALTYGHDDENILHHLVYLSIMNINIGVETNDLIKSYFENMSDENMKYRALGLKAYSLKKYKEAYDYYYQAFSIRPDNTNTIFQLTQLRMYKSFYFGLKRIIEKIGGFHLVYGLLLVMTIVCFYLNLTKIMTTTIVVVILLVVYWWSTNLIYNIKMKKFKTTIM